MVSMSSCSICLSLFRNEEEAEPATKSIDLKNVLVVYPRIKVCLDGAVAYKGGRQDKMYGSFRT